jgi:hypothetical protein
MIRYQPGGFFQSFQLENLGYFQDFGGRGGSREQGRKRGKPSGTGAVKAGKPRQNFPGQARI